MRIIPIYDLGKKEEVDMLLKRLDDNTIDSIKDLPDNMILLLPEEACPTMTLQELKEKMSDKFGTWAEKMRTDNGVLAD